MRTILNTLIIGFILLLLYVFIGDDYVQFYSGGKEELIASAEKINTSCNTDGSCPTNIEGWQPWGGGEGELSKGSMLYFVSPDEGEASGDKGKAYQEFRLVYPFFMPSKWFEAQGGVGREVTSEWKNR